MYNGSHHGNHPLCLHIFSFLLLTLTELICHINEEILGVVLNYGRIERSNTERGLRPGRVFSSVVGLSMLVNRKRIS